MSPQHFCCACGGAAMELTGGGLPAVAQQAGVEGAGRFAAALEKNQSVATLILSGNGIGVEGAGKMTADRTSPVDAPKVSGQDGSEIYSPCLSVWHEEMSNDPELEPVRGAERVVPLVPLVAVGGLAVLVDPAPVRVCR